MELWVTENHSPYVRFSLKIDKQVYSGQSEFQRIDIFDTLEFGRMLMLDGYVMLTEKDEFILQFSTEALRASMLKKSPS